SVLLGAIVRNDPNPSILVLLAVLAKGGIRHMYLSITHISIGCRRTSSELLYVQSKRFMVQHLGCELPIRARTATGAPLWAGMTRLGLIRNWTELIFRTCVWANDCVRSWD